MKPKEHRGIQAWKAQCWGQVTRMVAGTEGTCASAEDEGHLLVPSSQVNPHLGIPTALPQSPNPHGNRVHITHDTFCTLQVTAETPWSQNSPRKTTNLKLLVTAIFYFLFFVPAEHLFPAEQSSLHSFLAPPFASSFQKCKVPVLRPC